jgi:hypothetical protein
VHPESTIRAFLLSHGFAILVPTLSARSWVRFFDFRTSLLRRIENLVDTTVMMRPSPQIAFVVIFVWLFLPLSTQGQGSKKSEIVRALSSESGLIRYARFRGQPVPSRDLHLLLNRQAKWDKAQISDSSGLGSRLRFEKIGDPATPGAAAPSRYRVYAEGASPDKVFVLNTWLLDGTLTIDPRDMYVNAQGLVLPHKPKPEQEAVMKAVGEELEVRAGKGNGEPLRFVLTSRDGEASVYGTLVEHPLVSYDHECILEARVAQPNATAALIIADGFPARTKIPLVLESEGAQANDVLETNSDGHAVIAVLTTVPGKTQGTLKVTAEGHNCLPSVLVPWSVPANAAPKTPEH